MVEGVNDLPVIGITMGDAAGIGPEIVVKSLADQELADSCRCVIIGDAVLLRNTADALNINFEFGPLGSGEIVEIFDLRNLPDKFEMGGDSAPTGKAAAEYIEAAVEL